MAYFSKKVVAIFILVKASSLLVAAGPGFKAAITLTTTTVAATDIIVLQFENTYLILNFWLFIKKLRDAESQGGSKPQRLSCESNVPTT